LCRAQISVEMTAPTPEGVSGDRDPRSGPGLSEGEPALIYVRSERVTMARLYVELHPELAQQAKADVDMLVLRGDFGKRAQKAALAAQAH
jgi:hypothetical protein